MSSTTTSSTTSTTSTTSTNVFLDNFKNAFFEVFNKTNVLFFICFLAVYFVLYQFIRKWEGNENPMHASLSLTRSIDFLFLILFVLILYFSYYSLKNDEKNDLIGYILKWTKDFYNNTTTFFSLLITILLFYMVVYLCHIPMTKETKPFSMSFIENKLWILLLTVFIVDFFKYVFNISIVDLIYGEDDQLIHSWEKLSTGFFKKNETDISKNTLDVSAAAAAAAAAAPPAPKEEVFNISNNIHTYEDAQAICKAYDARLANYDEVEKSYNDGGEWCNYGWSDGQMILFPTQKKTWENLQKTKNKKNNCGRPGVNGGYIANPYTKFGVNCFGIKPAINYADQIRMNSKNAASNTNTNEPKTMEDQIMDAKVNYWKQHKNDALVLNSFNDKKWSEY